MVPGVPIAFFLIVFLPVRIFVLDNSVKTNGRKVLKWYRLFVGN